uniref:28S ribosomal protein S24, mitochondrial n=1 Tax=Parascaris univalens TaxID=6257 RepID=A0A915BIQ1_PARUN
MMTQVRAILSPRSPAIIPESLRRNISFCIVLRKNQAGKFQATIDRSQMLTYEMAQRPHHIGVKKAWLTWHSQNLEQFRQTQPYQVAQDEIIRRCIRGFFTQYLTVNGNELVIKRRGNCVYVAGFLQYSRRLDIRRIYWMFGFAEEFLSILLKQPVKLELQFVPNEETLAYNYI